MFFTNVHNLLQAQGGESSWQSWNFFFVTLMTNMMMMIALFSTLKQTHLRSHVILHEWIAFYSAFLIIRRSGIRRVLAWLVPHETAAVSGQVLCTPYNHASCHFMQSHICKVYACLAVTCHLHFWQNDRDLLRATAVTQGWNRYQNKSTESWPWRRKFSRRSCRDSNSWPFSHKSGALTTELSPLPINIYWVTNLWMNLWVNFHQLHMTNSCVN